MTDERYICIHGHFYQPPRENAWLEAVELQDSAYPYHDWNVRIANECYEANAASRILDQQGRIVQIVNNYSNIALTSARRCWPGWKNMKPGCMKKLFKPTGGAANGFQATAQPSPRHTTI
jgi:hypothetical protein